jgi:hypothetical protein
MSREELVEALQANIRRRNSLATQLVWPRSMMSLYWKVKVSQKRVKKKEGSMSQVLVVADGVNQELLSRR